MVIEVSNNKLDHERLAEVFKALSDRNRLAIFRILRGACGGAGCDSGCDVNSPEARRTVSELAEQLRISLPTVSHHLKELRRAGLIHTKREGRRVHCSINVELLVQLSAFFVGLEGG